MGIEEALDPQDEVAEIETTDVVEETPNTDGDETAVEVVTEDEAENEIVLDGDEGSQPDKQRGFQKRVNKLNGKVEEAVNKASDAESRAVIAEERAKLLQMALEQRKDAGAANIPPDPDDFEGVSDPKYAEALATYNQPLIDAAIQRQTSQLSQKTQDEVDNSKLVKMQEKHYERADELKIKDYEETEDKAIAILGNETANAIIKLSDKSHILFYHFGKNPSKAERIAELAKSDPGKALLELGALAEKLKVKPKGRKEPVPNPDEELSGGVPSARNGKRGPQGAKYS